MHCIVIKVMSMIPIISCSCSFCDGLTTIKELLMPLNEVEKLQKILNRKSQEHGQKDKKNSTRFLCRRCNEQSIIQEGWTFVMVILCACGWLIFTYMTFAKLPQHIKHAYVLVNCFSICHVAMYYLIYQDVIVDIGEVMDTKVQFKWD